MFILGLIIHLTFLYSIFDIYFKSPIVKNVVPYQPHHEAQADRLVLFVVDGLRAESFVNYTTMIYMRSVANSNGRWGISNTQVPTESRPGHVALIAGFYEDPSAVFKGWKENPVDFDSVFNQSTHTWCWGTYDIVNIFTKGVKDNHIEVQDFDPYEQSFSTDKNTTQLDAWVFDKVKNFFAHAKDNSDIQENLHKKKIVLFLHLLGTDTAGHMHKPKTLNFLKTIKHADEGIKQTEQIIRDYYGDDGKTTFLMTSDHGMTNWGSHGSGDNHETQTPYVIWGSGVQQAKKGEWDPETLKMSLNHRLDINQVDLSPLMSTILSIPVPVNSVGKPIEGLLDMSIPNKAKSIYSISRQLASQYDRKRQDVEKNALPMLYQPYEPFTKQKYDEMITFTERLLRDQDYKELIIFSKEMVNLSLSGLRYYHDYYQTPLLILVTMSFLGWIACLLRVLSEQKVTSQEEVVVNKKKTNYMVLKYGKEAVCFLLLSVGSYPVYVQNLPVQYYIYVQMPILLWTRAIFPINVWIRTFKQLKSSRCLISICFEVISYIVGCWALGMSFTYRWTLSIPLLGMGLWPLLSLTRNDLSKLMIIAWAIGAGVLSSFSFMPVVGKQTCIDMVLIAGLLWLLFLVVHIWATLWPQSTNEASQLEVILTVLQMGLLVIALHNIFVQSKRFERQTPVSYFDQTVAWIVAGYRLWHDECCRTNSNLNPSNLISNFKVDPRCNVDRKQNVVSPVIPMMFSKKILNRLMAINTALLTFYLMMSVAQEGVFMVTMAVHSLSWVLIEFYMLHSNKVELTDCTFDPDKNKCLREFYVERSLSRHDFRRALFFVLYIILAFFGTGNIASLNSFEIRWVTCFVTSFNPFLITTLIMLKTFAPFMVVGCAFVAIQTLTKAPIGCLNIIVLIYSNLMGIQLLYNVRNTGSWLEIGTSISQFVIVQLITVFIVIINKIAKFYVDVTIAGKFYWNGKKYV